MKSSFYIFIILLIISFKPIYCNGSVDLVNSLKKAKGATIIQGIHYIDFKMLGKILFKEQKYEISGNSLITQDGVLKTAAGSFFIVYDKNEEIYVAQMTLPVIERKSKLLIPLESFVNSAISVGFFNNLAENELNELNEVAKVNNIINEDEQDTISFSNIYDNLFPKKSIPIDNMNSVHFQSDYDNYEATELSEIEAELLDVLKNYNEETSILVLEILKSTPPQLLKETLINNKKNNNFIKTDESAPEFIEIDENKPPDTYSLPPNLIRKHISE